MNNFNFPGANKFMDRMFRKADGVVWDLMTGKIGIQTDGGIVTLDGEGDDARVSINLLDEFGVAMPAFAQSTPVDQITVGDIIYTGKREAIRFVIGTVDAPKPAAKTTKTAAPVAVAAASIKKFRTMTLDGTSSTWTPPKVSILGFDSGVMVLRSLMTLLPNGNQGLSQMQSMLMPMLMMGGGDLGEDMDKMLPMMLMSQMGGGDSGSMGNMMQMMFMMKMMNGDKGGFGGKSASPFNRG